MLTFKNRVIFVADATVNQDPNEEVLAEVTKQTGKLARRFNIEPRAALLSYSNFGSVDNEGTRKPRKAAAMLQDDPEVDFTVDGEMQADTAVVEDILEGTYGFSELEEPANVLVFPNLESGNIGYKLLQRLGGADAIGRCWSAWTHRSTSSSGATRSRTSSTWPASRSSTPSRSERVSEHAAPRDGDADQDAADAASDRDRSEAGGARVSRRTLLGTAATAGAVGLAGCTAASTGHRRTAGRRERRGRADGYVPLPADDGQSMFRRGLRRYGYYPDATVPEAVRKAWSFPVNRIGHTAAKSTPRPTPDGETVLVAGDTGRSTPSRRPVSAAGPSRPVPAGASVSTERRRSSATPPTSAATTANSTPWTFRPGTSSGTPGLATSATRSPSARAPRTSTARSIS